MLIGKSTFKLPKMLTVILFSDVGKKNLENESTTTDITEEAITTK
jgi:hypothetical protein